MSARKSERLLNLLITLLVSRTYVTKARLRQVIEDYRTGSDDAFEKMFERDKEDLRRLGIPIEVGSHDPLFDDDPGYRIVRAAFELPEVALSADEAAVVGLAARVWQHAGLAAATSDALVKLKAAGVEVDRQAIDLVQPHIAADEPSFAGFWEAVLARRPVRFGYRAGAATAPATRHLRPWGVVSSRGRWYVVGHDTDRDAPRLFRLSRVQGDVERDGPDGAFTVPDGTDLRALTAALAPEPATRTATLLVRDGTAHGLRRRATSSRSGAEGWSVLEVPFGRDDALADEVLGHGADAVVEAPEDLRDLVLARLRVLAGRPERAEVPGEATTGDRTAPATTGPAAPEGMA
jgi:proteasome accessory factor B